MGPGGTTADGAAGSPHGGRVTRGVVADDCAGERLLEEHLRVVAEAGGVTGAGTDRAPSAAEALDTYSQLWSDADETLRRAVDAYRGFLRSQDEPAAGY